MVIPLVATGRLEQAGNSIGNFEDPQVGVRECAWPCMKRVDFSFLVAKLTVHTGPLPAERLCIDSSCFESRARTHPWERTCLGFPCHPIKDSHCRTRAGPEGTPMNTVDSGLWVEATLPRNLLRSFFFRTLKAGWRITAFGLVFVISRLYPHGSFLFCFFFFLVVYFIYILERFYNIVLVSAIQ